MTELDVAVEAARAGGAVLRAGLDRADLEVHEKDGARTSIVTWADLRSQEAIVWIIRSAYPGHAVVGEEGTTGDPSSRDVWFVDPLDGTTNYAHGLPFYCVSIARRDPDGIALGVVYDPDRDDLFAAVRGEGAMHNGERMTVSRVADLRDSLLATQVQSDDPSLLDRYATRSRRFVGVARDHRAMGAPALNLAYVACGRLDGFCEPGLSLWDTLAGTLLVEEAGGLVTRFDGGARPLEAAADILASNGLLHAQLVELLEPEAGGSVPVDLGSVIAIE